MSICKEEQLCEFEALEAIYTSELTVLQKEPFHVFSIAIQTDELDESEEQMSAELKFSYIKNYPQEMPLIEIENPFNLEDDDQEMLLRLLDEEGQNILGEVMIYTLVSAAIDWLKRHADEKKENKIREIENEKQREEAEELKKFEGTRVTIESFLAWKTVFDSEIYDMKKQSNRLERSIEKKLTGKEMFEKDKTMNESDLQFLQDGEEEVKVDESLFQELDGLDLDAALEDFED